ncbi:MAG: hypothetical protein IJF54_05160 [Clostridia bacterium]|nr:hypothetical protein [Clostridia bacterium]
MSKSFSPLLGFAKSQLRNSMFAGLIFIILMVAIAFTLGLNQFYGYTIRDVAATNSAFTGFSCAVAAVAFVFAAYIFKPFMSKNERDTILALPIKKTHMISLQVIFGLIIIIAGTVLSFALFYPAMNLNRFNEVGSYSDAISSMITGIIIPLCIYYTLSVVLILRTSNFLSSAFLLAGICVFSLFSNTYISLHSGMNSMGADISEFAASVQPFYCSAEILLPTQFIASLLKLAFGIKTSAISSSVLILLLNILTLVICSVLVVFAAKAVYLGEINRPFAVIPFLKALPFAIIIAICPVAVNIEKSGISIFIIAAIVSVIAIALILVLFRNIKKSIVPVIACLLVVFLPTCSVFADSALSKNITYDVPDVSNIEAVYFNAANPISMYEYKQGAFRNCSMTDMRAGTRYKFESEDAIKRIVKLHQTIVDNIKENDLLNIEYLKVNGNMSIVANGALQFYYDEYQNDMTDDSDMYIDEDKNWDLFNKLEVQDSFYMADSSIEITPNRYLNVSGDDILEIDSSVEYNATFYYKLRDGRMFCRSYRPIPVSWIRRDMLSVLSCQEYKENEMDYIKSISETQLSYGADLRYGEGAVSNRWLPERGYFSDTQQQLKLVLALYEDEWNYTNSQIEEQEIVYTIRSDCFSLIDLSGKSIYVRSGYTNTLAVINEIIGGEQDEQEQPGNNWGNWGDWGDWGNNDGGYDFGTWDTDKEFDGGWTYDGTPSEFN